MPLESKEYLEPYRTGVFVETGSLVGDGIQTALDAGYEKVYSVEINPGYYYRTKSRFSGNNRVELFFGDSRNVLPIILRGINCKATFWLDAHQYGPEQDTRPELQIANVLSAELGLIAAHHIKNHNIIVDDVMFPPSGVSQDDWGRTILEMVKRINTNYVLRPLPYQGREGYIWAFAVPDVCPTREKKIIGQPWGGLGDNLQFSTLPEILTGMGHDVYISSQNVVRNKGIHELVWGCNPFVKGVIEESPNIVSLDDDRMTDLRKRGYNYLQCWEMIYTGKVVNKYPRIYYEPKELPEFRGVTVIELSSVTLDMRSYRETILGELKKRLKPNDKVVVVDNHMSGAHSIDLSECSYHTPVSIFEFVDILHSCGQFIGLESGGVALASAVRREAGGIVAFWKKDHGFIFENQEVIMMGNAKVNPAVSVLIGAYNEEKVVTNAVKSVLEQEFGDFELIVGLNGCTDGTKEVLKQFSDPRLRVIEYPEKGRVTTLNKMLAEAKGEFIAILDADDTWLPAKLRRQIEEFGDRDVMGTFISYVSEAGIVPTDAISLTTHQGIVDAFLVKGDNQIANSSCLVRKEFVESLGGWKDVVGVEDLDLWLRAIKAGAKFGNVPERLVNHFVGASTKFNPLQEAKDAKGEILRAHGVRTRVGLLVVATGRYSRFVHSLQKSVRKYFLPGLNVTTFVFSDSDDLPSDVVRIRHRSSPWPLSTMMRYEAYVAHAEQYENMEYLFAIDADMLFAGEFEESILDKMIGIRHPGFYNKPRSEWSYERRPESHAFIAENVPMQGYYCGGFLGGWKGNFLKMARQITEWAKDDMSRGVIPVWHDESYVNKWFALNWPVRDLSPEYCYPESWNLPFKKRLIALDKKHDDMRSGEELSVMVVSKDRPFFLRALLMSLKDVCFDLTVLYLGTTDAYRAAYEKVKREVWWAKFIDQGQPGDMQPHFKKWIETSSEAVMVCPDDNICNGVVDTDTIKKLMDGARFGFTLRLHPGIRNSQEREHSFSIANPSNSNVVEYKPISDTTSTWGYVWEMSSTFYRRGDMKTIVDMGPFRTINELESRGIGIFKPSSVPNMLCFNAAPIVNIFVETNIEGSKWCLGQRVSDQQALELFERGAEIDVGMTFHERDVTSCTHVKKLFLKGDPEPATSIPAEVVKVEIPVQKNESVLVVTPDSKKLGNKAIVVIAERNCAKFLHACLHSIVNQTYKDIGVIVVDDVSDDGSADLAERCLADWHSKIVVRNKERKFALVNIDDAITQFCSNENSVVFLIDGDDWLLEWTAIEEMMKAHEGADVVWSQYMFSNCQRGTSGPIPPAAIPRKYPWVSSHLRSFKKFLFDAIDRKEFLDEDGLYFRVTWDQCIMYPIIEMTPSQRRRFIDRMLYQYNLHDLNDGHTTKGHDDQVRAENIIRARGPAPIHPRYVNLPKRMMTVSVVVSSFNQKPVLEMFLDSLYYQNVPPKEVIIADDGSDDGTLEWIAGIEEKYPFAVLHTTRRNKGYRLASLENMGASQATGERILFTNADVVHAPGSIMAHAMIPVDTVGAGVVKGIGSAASIFVTKAMMSSFGVMESLATSAPSQRSNEKYLSTDPAKDQAGVWGGNLSVPVALFRKIGGFDMKFDGKWGGEDADIVRRLVAAGARAQWVNGSVGWHLDHSWRDYHFKTFAEGK